MSYTFVKCRSLIAQYVIMKKKMMQIVTMTYNMMLHEYSTKYSFYLNERKVRGKDLINVFIGCND